jgi:L-threonylcarbamoyladenylate synthase
MDIIKLVTEDECGLETALERGASVIKNGGVVMHATETCYGLAADIFNKAALDKLYAIKQMSKEKPVSIMVSSFLQAQKYAFFNELGERLADKFWPGPVTIVLPRKKMLPVFLNEDNDFVGIRCPDHAVAFGLIVKTGNPLTTTSANVSGLPEVYEIDGFLDQMTKSDVLPDLIIDTGLLPKNPPSTIVKFSGNEVVYLRKGSLFNDVKSTVE